MRTDSSAMRLLRAMGRVDAFEIPLPTQAGTSLRIMAAVAHKPVLTPLTRQATGTQSASTEAHNLDDLEATVLDEQHVPLPRSLTALSDDPRTAYLEQIKEEIRNLRGDSRRYRRISAILQSAIIVSALVAFTVILGSSFHLAAVRWISLGSSLIAAMSASFAGYFRFQERSFFFQLTADALESEWERVELGNGQYKDLSDEDRMQLFIEETQLIRANHYRREQIHM